VRLQQYLILVAGTVLAFLIYFFGKTQQAGPAAGVNATEQLDFSDYEALQLSVLPQGDAERLRSLKSITAIRPDLATYLELSRAWEESGNYPLGAFYYYEAAGFSVDSVNWEAAGDKFMIAYNNYGDSLISNNLINFAVASFRKARMEDNSNLAVRMKLAETYVESPDPMKGIVILRELADSLPEYVPAQMRLGRLSLQTGQYEKAHARFQQVLENNPANTEALYFLALSNEGLGNIEEAIRQLELCKQLVANPAFSQEIDVYINELKKRS
jgi:tetratricopeptide (TPR) repeat protein